MFLLLSSHFAKLLHPVRYGWVNTQCNKPIVKQKQGRWQNVLTFFNLILLVPVINLIFSPQVSFISTSGHSCQRPCSQSAVSITPTHRMTTSSPVTGGRAVHSTVTVEIGDIRLRSVYSAQPRLTSPRRGVKHLSVLEQVFTGQCWKTT